MKLIDRLHRTQGHHWKLITATFVVLTIAGGLALIRGWLTLSVAILLGILILAVQWYCIDVPDVDDKELH